MCQQSVAVRYLIACLARRQPQHAGGLSEFDCCHCRWFALLTCNDMLDPHVMLVQVLLCHLLHWMQR